MNEADKASRAAPRRSGRLASVGALFLSTGTLLCCALPIALVSLGFGAVVATVIDAAPWLVGLSRYKAWLFAGTAALLAAAGWLLYRAGRECPADPALAAACRAADRWNRRILWSASAVWLAGAFMAYLWLPLRQFLEH